MLVSGSVATLNSKLCLCLDVGGSLPLEPTTTTLVSPASFSDHFQFPFWIWEKPAFWDPASILQVGDVVLQFWFFSFKSLFFKGKALAVDGFQLDQLAGLTRSSSIRTTTQFRGGPMSWLWGQISCFFCINKMYRELVFSQHVSSTQKKKEIHTPQKSVQSQDADLSPKKSLYTWIQGQIMPTLNPQLWIQASPWEISLLMEEIAGGAAKSCRLLGWIVGTRGGWSEGWSEGWDLD